MDDKLPQRCSHCLAPGKDFPPENCQICQDQGMKESFLCLLRRKGADLSSFKCHAFRPHLTLVGKGRRKSDSLSTCQDKKGYFSEVVQMISSSGGCAGGGCGGGQCGAGNKPAAGSKKYHVVWGVHRRNPLFAQSDRYVSYFHDVLLSCGQLMKGRVLLLWLAPDHLHLYIEYDGKNSITEVVEDLQGLVHDTLIEEFSEFASEAKTKIWENDFFFEEI